MISQLETSAPKEIMVKSKMQTGVSLFSRGTGGTVNPVKRIPRKKLNEITCNVSSKKGSNSKLGY